MILNKGLNYGILISVVHCFSKIFLPLRCVDY